MRFSQRETGPSRMKLRKLSVYDNRRLHSEPGCECNSDFSTVIISVVAMIASRVLPLLLLVADFVLSQEIRHIDLTAVKQRTQLPYPPETSVNCEEAAVCSGRGSAGTTLTALPPHTPKP